MEVITLVGGPPPFDGQRREVGDSRIITFMVPIQGDTGLVFHEWKRVRDTSVFSYVESERA